ncbi:MAG: deoxyribonuclease IV [Patescibacteria group bacterium]|jgi:deoxyribonuclease-4
MLKQSKKSQPKCKVGAHISAAGDVSLAPLRAQEAGCECFQFFSRPPQGGKAKPIDLKTADLFISRCKNFKMESYIHAPYYINLASANNRIYYGSIAVIREELERGSKLGVKYLMTHLGSAKELGDKDGIKKIIKGIGEILKGYKGKTEFLIEMAAGSGSIMGDTFEEIGAIINSKELKKYNIGVCFDTCHGFASGYDLRNEQEVKKTFDKFNKILGIKRLKLIHANDSMTELGSHKDRHEHIGEGKIGLRGFKAIVKLACKQKVNLILETQHDEKFADDLKILKNLRK